MFEGRYIFLEQGRPMSSTRGTEQSSTARMLGPLKITQSDAATQPALVSTTPPRFTGALEIVENYTPASAITIEVIHKKIS